VVCVTQTTAGKISEKDIPWATIILVMETEHRAKIKEIYAHLSLPTIQVLHIADEYDFMDAELVEILKEKIEMALAEIK
jgi:predicted protein tyrosine phosphatase